MQPLMEAHNIEPVMPLSSIATVLSHSGESTAKKLRLEVAVEGSQIIMGSVKKEVPSITGSKYVYLHFLFILSRH